MFIKYIQYIKITGLINGFDDKEFDDKEFDKQEFVKFLITYINQINKLIFNNYFFRGCKIRIFSVNAKSFLFLFPFLIKIKMNFLRQKRKNEVIIFLKK